MCGRRAEWAARGGAGDAAVDAAWRAKRDVVVVERQKMWLPIQSSPVPELISDVGITAPCGAGRRGIGSGQLAARFPAPSWRAERPPRRRPRSPASASRLSRQPRCHVSSVRPGRRALTLVPHLHRMRRLESHMFRRFSRDRLVLLFFSLEVQAAPPSDPSTAQEPRRAA
jgi:hypothetical protein